MFRKSVLKPKPFLNQGTLSLKRPPPFGFHTISKTRKNCLWEAVFLPPQKNFSLVNNMINKNYTMTFNNLLKPVCVENSSWKIKKDMILILCRKKEEEKCERLTQVEKETKEKETAAYDTSDPSERLMNLLKKMYAEGDDEMKRSINKAWVESREKQVQDDLPIDI
uniref:SGS domain-containing protein n=1 Tax=Podarcis muralis TaxID=64176 RepID=A0A670KAG8_PODMU